MSTANVHPAIAPKDQERTRFYGASREGARMLESATPEQRVHALVVLRVMNTLEREIAPLRPMGLADDKTIAARACLTVYGTRQTLRLLRAAGYVDSCLSELRWSLTERGRKGIL